MSDVKVTLNTKGIEERFLKMHKKAQYTMSTQALKDCNYYIYSGRKIKLNISFDTVLNMYDIFKDNFLLEQEKAQFALSLLVKGNKTPNIKVLDIIFKEQIETFQRQSSQNQLRVVDFKQDSSYIYSSFLMDYGIDLIEQQGKLHWQKFISLFQGLSEKTKIREVMSIRARPIPKPDKYNQEYIHSLTELKTYYALEISQEEKERNFQEGLKRLAETLKMRAKA